MNGAYQKVHIGDSTIWYSVCGKVEGVVTLGKLDLNSISAERLYRGLERLAGREGCSTRDIIRKFYIHEYIGVEQLKQLLDIHYAPKNTSES